MTSLETERLLLRPFREEDLDAYAQMCADPEVMRYIGAGVPLSREESWRQMAMFLGHWELRGYGIWAAQEKSSGELLGRVGLYNPEGWPGLEVGWLLERDAWGNGYATEAGQASLDWAFSELGADHVISLIRPDNTASIAVARRIGESYEREMSFLGGEVVVYGKR